MKFRTLLISLLALITLTLAACSSDEKSDDAKSDGEEKLKVYTTVFPLYSMTEQIAGDTVDVESVYPKNVNMHNYEPSQQDILNYAKDISLWF